MDEGLVKKAFNEVLGREPDKRALDFYKQKDISYERLYNLLCRKLKSNNVPNHSSLSFPLAQIYVLKNIKVLYCPILKNASSTLKFLMFKLCDIEEIKKLLDKGTKNILTLESTGIQLRDLSAEEVNDVLGDGGYFKFAVLRHPASRLLSAYWEKFVLNRMRKENVYVTKKIIEEVQPSKGYDLDKGITFYDFVKYFVSKEPLDLNPHWRPQYTYLEGVDYDAFYAMNNLKPLYDELSQRSGKNVEPKLINVTNSGKGEIKVKDAMFMLPKELLKHGLIKKECFFNNQINNMINKYFSKDIKLYKECIH